jgi:hypothetical protein
VNEEESPRPRKIAKIVSDDGGNFAEGSASVSTKKWSDALFRDHFKVKSYL